ncbi:MAG: PD40 domain-containing protein, partial [Planctomycetes bacterium]|nr:PD40 domain-containing protein [Planctomycetota bacterium]
MLPRFVSLALSLWCAFGASAQSPSDQDAWNVDAPRGPTFERALDTDVGTWMSVDVSPDGKSVAFDLLGDIYVMPIEGDASGDRVRKLTGGVSWDMQPRFSPDGKRLAFTSDRNAVDAKGKLGKAGDNIWTITLDGGELTQITTETFRLLNGAAWTPDGEYIVARKHFSSRRSLGAGEMWMYHASGVRGGATSGMQLTERPNDQKDVNEPVFSPCGRYVYFSRDATPGETFEYNKDSNGQIYVVERLDRETGETELTIGGPGGACRPTPSPDGEKLAFVRRFDGRSALHVLDLRSGRVDMVHDDLERDMQEAWAIHGVYPTMAWTPDSRSIVFWARGKIRRIDLDAERARGEVSVIPFRVRDTRTLADPVRSPIEVAPDAVAVRMLQDVTVSPDGGKVAFQALGRIWIRDLDGGEPVRLTDQPQANPLGRFEFFPSWSRDGRQVVFATWNDDELGEVRVVDVATRAERTLTPERGHYVSPVFDPSGAHVVYRKVGGGAIRSPLWSRRQGIYRVTTTASDAEPELLTRSGSDPQFGASDDLLFVSRSNWKKDADNRTLVAIDLTRDDDKRERELYESSWATRYQVSPDGKWLAFQERFHVHLTPLVRTGKTVKIGPDATSLPVAKAGKEAGWYVHFSGDSQKLHWSLGPTLYTRPLVDSFAFLAGGEELPEPTVAGVDIGFSVPHAKPDGVKALVGGTVYTMASAGGDFGRIDDAVVVIDGNRVRAIGARDAVAIPDGADVLDVTGQVVLPGFLEAHGHGPMATQGLTPQRNWVNYVRLAFGVTTVHDPSNDTAAIFSS